MKNYKEYFLSDPHFGHDKITDFVDDNGNFIRPVNWKELLIANWKKTVRPQDRVRILGDAAITKKALEILKDLPGKKYLIAGNHDILETKDYLKCFKRVSAYKVMPEYGIIFSHIPIHPESLGRFIHNVHGHTHHNNLRDNRYLNICVEQTNYELLSLEQILDKFGIKR